jgi:hypothetical protein
LKKELGNNVTPENEPTRPVFPHHHVPTSSCSNVIMRNTRPKPPLPLGHLSNSKEHTMAVKHGDRIVETTREARQAERGPSMRNVLVVSIGLVIVVFAASWLMFFPTP